MATRPSVLAWKIPWAEEPGGRCLVGYSPWGHKESDTAERLNRQTIGSYWWRHTCSAKGRFFPKGRSFQGLDSTPRGIAVSRTF